MIRFFILLVLITFSNYLVNAQEYAGVWQGHYTYGKKSYEYELIIFQDNKVLTGTASTINKKDSAKYYFNGTVSNGVVELSCTSFIYKKGLYCLPKLKLQLTDLDKLEGTYGSNVVWGGCLPLVKGDVSLTKVESHTPQVVDALTSEPVVIDDFEGVELMKELKERTYHALVIAIDEYPDPDIPTLNKPIADAQKLINTLQTYYTFENQNITFLKNPTRSELIEAFDELSKIVGKRDNLLIFYAGHGIWDERLKQGFWLPTNASKNSKAQWLSNGTIRDYIRAIDSKHTLLIADACFGGSLLKERAVFFNGKAMLEMYKRPSRKVMTSGALTTVPDESVFIKYLVKNLVNTTAPLISAEQVFGDFKVAVINNSETGQVPQYGAITLAGDEGGDFIFLRRDAP